MTTDSWEQVLDTYQAQIYELCNRAVAHARLHDEIDRIVANWADEKITIENAVELIKEAAKKCEADIDSGRALGQGLRTAP